MGDFEAIVQFIKDNSVEGFPLKLVSWVDCLINQYLSKNHLVVASLYYVLDEKIEHFGSQTGKVLKVYLGPEGLDFHRDNSKLHKTLLVLLLNEEGRFFSLFEPYSQLLLLGGSKAK